MSELQDRLQAVLGPSYRVERELGGGGMSRVFLSEEVALARKVVVKVLPPDMAAGLNADRFRREIQLAASLQHPHIVPLIASGQTGDLVWYTMPFIQGESLRAKLARERELPVGEAVRILRDVSDALSYAHENGVVHRDIKPDNVLITGRHAVVTDFGVAKAVSASTGESSLTSIGIALGTPAYMSPEQASADPTVDHRADIYSVGAMAYEMLSGAPPFSGPPPLVLAAHVTQAPEPVSHRRSSIPPALGTLIMRALEKKPADRWQTASELHQQFELMATPSGGAQPTSATMATAPSRKARRPFWIGASVAAAAALVAVASWAAFKPGSGVDEVVLDPRIVAVLPFRVAGADPSLHYLRQGMLDLLQAKLTGEGGPRAADARSVLAAFRDAGGSDQSDVADDGVTAIARRVGAARVVQGSIVGPPDHIVLNAALLEVPGGRSLAQTSVEGPRDSLFVLVDRLAAQLLALGSGATAQQLSALTTTRLDALRAYLDGVAAMRRAAFTSSTEHLVRAVQLDSTFALALSALIEANGWVGANIDMGRVNGLAWQYRDRLSPNDRLILSIRLGSRFPDPTPSMESLADRERATRLMPDNAEAWYYLGDELFHGGRLSDVPNSLPRAKDAFLRAFQLDTLFGAVITHLANIALVEADSSAAQLWLKRQTALDSTDARMFLDLRFSVASLLGDADALRALWPAVDSSPRSAGDLLGMASFDTSVVRNGERLLAAMSRNALSPEERRDVINNRITLLWNLGRPNEASRWIDSLAALGELPQQIVLNRTMRTVLFSGNWGSETPLPPILNTGPIGLFAMEVTKLSHGDTSSVDKSIANMRRMASDGNDNVLRLQFVLEGFAAAVKRDRNALVALERADSAVRGWSFRSEAFSIILGKAWFDMGRHDRAQLAIRRRLAPLGFPSTAGVAELFRLEGQISAKAGDVPGAILAYERYLMLRHDPEPAKKPQRDSVVAELAALRR